MQTNKIQGAAVDHMDFGIRLLVEMCKVQFWAEEQQQEQQKNHYAYIKS